MLVRITVGGEPRRYLLGTFFYAFDHRSYYGCAETGNACLAERPYIMVKQNIDMQLLWVEVQGGMCC